MILAPEVDVSAATKSDPTGEERSGGVMRGMLRGAGLALVAFALAGCVAEPAPPPDLEAGRGFDRHALYWLGPEFEGLPLTYLELDSEIPSVVYGDCDASEHPCTLPLDIQITPLCRHLEVVSVTAEPQLVRGAPLGRSDGAPVLLTRTVQIKVYAYDEALALRALQALRSLNDVEPVVPASEPFPPPAAGVLGGSRRCA
jgi:hypothetical protein